MHAMIFDHKWTLFRTFQLGTSLSLAVIVTAALILLMYSLIATNPPEINEEKIKIPVVVMPEDRAPTVQEPPDIEKPVEPMDEPVVPQISPTIEPVETQYAINAPSLDQGDVTMDGGARSGSVMPVLRVAPRYPERARVRGIQGFVDLMFDITATGKTENIRILHSEPAGMFDRASMRALQRWKYKPAYDGDVAIVLRNQTTRITFNLDN